MVKRNTTYTLKIERKNLTQGRAKEIGVEIINSIPEIIGFKIIKEASQ